MATLAPHERARFGTVLQESALASDAQVILSVPHYDFNWQLGYDTSIRVPKGAVLHVDAHYDNSANKKFNPNPNRTVYYGTMTWKEMMFPFFGVVVDKSADPRKIIKSANQAAGGG